jgi:formate-dependent nitrite reductase cytochrome c552 subunit
MQHDPVDIDLGRYHTAMDADEGIAEWIADQQIKEEAVAQAALAKPAAWEWDSATHVLTNTSKVPYTAEEVLIEAMDNSQDARDAYAELMASPAAAKLRQLLAEHWAREMYETRTFCEISAAIAAEREA